MYWLCQPTHTRLHQNSKYCGVYCVNKQKTLHKMTHCRQNRPKKQLQHKIIGCHLINGLLLKMPNTMLIEASISSTFNPPALQFTAAQLFLIRSVWWRKLRALYGHSHWYNSESNLTSVTLGPPNGFRLIQGRLKNIRRVKGWVTEKSAESHYGLYTVLIKSQKRTCSVICIEWVMYTVYYIL